VKAFDEVLHVPTGDVTLLATVTGAFTMRRTAVVFHAGHVDGAPSLRQSITRSLSSEGFAVIDVPLVLPFERRRRTPLAERALHARAEAAVHTIVREVGAPVAAIGVGAFSGAALAAAGNTPSDVSAVAIVGGRPTAARTRLRNVQAPALLIVEQRDPVVIDAFRMIADDIPAVAELRLVADRARSDAARTESLVAQWCVRYTPIVVPLAAIERMEQAAPTAAARPEVSA
jgi:hypothetical protein